MIYQLNLDNTFSELTDHISNEFYAFEFLLEQNIKEGKMYGIQIKVMEQMKKKDTLT